MLTALSKFAQDFNYTYSDPSMTTSADAEASAFLSVPVIIIMVVLAVVTVVGLWKVFVKAGRPGWQAIVPFYNYYVLLQIVGRPTWWILFLLASFIPFVGSVVALVVGIIVSHDLSKSFGKSVGMTLLQIFLPFVAYPVLGFGDAKYGGPSVKPEAPAAGTTPPPATPAV